jgi:hypothetical protein
MRAATARSIWAATASLGLLCGAALADNGRTTVYKWVDAQGVVHYSDQPHPNAQKLEIQGAQTFSALPLPQTPSTPAAQAPQPASAAGYDTCSIAQPADQQMLMNVYQATAVVQTSPSLHPGDQIHLFVDGKQIQGSGTSFTFPVYRGQHSVQAVIEDTTGQIVCETSSVTFYVHQPSVQNPHNPVHPH